MINFSSMSVTNTDKMKQLFGENDVTIVREPFTISWSAATTTTGSIDKYEVWIVGNLGGETYSTTVDANTLSATITPLVGGGYKARVKAIDTTGDSKTIFDNHDYVVRDYSPPTCSYNITRDGSQLKVSLNITYSSLGYKTVDKHNDVKLSSISYAYSQGTESSPSNWTSLSSSSYGITTSTRSAGTINENDSRYVLSVLTLDNDSFCNVNLADSDYEFALRFHDDIYPGDEFRITASIPGLSPIFGEFDDGHVVVGMYPEFGDDALLQVGGEILAYDNSTAHHVASELAALQSATSGLSTMQSDINNLKSEVGVGVAVSTPTRIDNLEDLISSLYYKPGDSVTFTEIYLAGFITNGGKDICWSIVPPKPLAPTVRSFSVSNAKARVRANGVYVWGTADSNGMTNLTGTFSYGSLTNTGGILNIKHTASTGTTSNAQQACGIHLTCTITFS